jgi:hypothetical protein
MTVEQLQDLVRKSVADARADIAKASNSSSIGLIQKALAAHVAHVKRLAKLHENSSNPAIAAEYSGYADILGQLTGASSHAVAPPATKAASTTEAVSDFWKRFYDDGDERGLAALKLEKAAAGNIFD